MITCWMRQMKKIRPWMVAVALACGAPLWSPACGGGDDSGQDVAPDATEATEDAATPDDGGSPDEAAPGEDATTPDDGSADCVPAVFYGPPELCTDTAQCETDFGAGWTCTGYQTYPDTCGGTINWGPFCENPAGADADADVGDLYGPPPADADAADDSPAGWYGPPPTDVTDTPGNLYGPPPPDDAGDAPATLYGPSIPDA
jgi:hypothetical protein